MMVTRRVALTEGIKKPSARPEEGKGVGVCDIQRVPLAGCGGRFRARSTSGTYPVRLTSTAAVVFSQSLLRTHSIGLGSTSHAGSRALRARAINAEHLLQDGTERTHATVGVQTRAMVGITPSFSSFKELSPPPKPTSKTTSSSTRLTVPWYTYTKDYSVGQLRSPISQKRFDQKVMPISLHATVEVHSTLPRYS